MTVPIDTITSKMAQRPRLTIEVDNQDINKQLKFIALRLDKTVRQVVLEALASTYPEMKQNIDNELGSKLAQAIEKNIADEQFKRTLSE